MILKVNDSDIEINESADILLNLKAAKIGEIETRSGNFSWAFTVPNTADNFIVLSEVSKIATANKGFYLKLDAKLEDTQSNVVDNGFLLVEGFSETQIKCRFVSGNFDWIQGIQTESIRDLESLCTLDHDYTEANITASASNTTADGYVYCPIDSGINHRDGYVASLAVELLSFIEWVPSLFCHQLLKRIFDDKGIKLTGSLMDDPNFKNLVIPCSDGVRYTEATVEVENMFVGKSANQVLNGTSDVACTFDLETSPYFDTGNNFLTDTYTVPINGEINLTWVISTTATGSGASGEYDRVILIRGANTLILADDIYNGSENSRQTVRVRVQANDTLQIIRPGTVIGSGNHTINAGTTLSVTYFTECIEGSTLEFAATAPDMLQSDFVKAVFNIFAVVPSYDTQQKVLTLNTFDTIYDNVGSAKDWSDKIDLGKSWEVDIVKAIQNYAQSMVFKYADDPLDHNVEAYNLANLVPFGQGSLDIESDILDEQKTAYESVIAPTITVVPIGGDGSQVAQNLPFIPMFSYERKEFADLETGDFVTNIYGGTPDDNSGYVQTAAIGGASLYTDTFNSGGSQRTLTASNTHIVVTRQKPVYRFLMLTDQTTTFYDYTSRLAYFYNNMLSSELGETGSFSPSFGVANVDLFSGVYDPFNAIELYWRNYERMINAPKELEAVFRLEGQDIYNLDFSIPIYIKHFDSYFYINEIKNYDGIFATVELIYLT